MPPVVGNDQANEILEPSTPAGIRIASPELRKSRSPLAPFKIKAYRQLWGASLMWNQARWIDQVVIGWSVLEMTNSAWDVAVVGVLRWMPVAIFGIFGGAIADKYDRRKLLIVSQIGGAIVSLLCGLLLAFDLFNYPLAVAAALIFGLQWAIDWPSRRAIIPDLVGRELTLSAMVLENVSMNVTRIIGPLMAGGLIHFWGSASAFFAMAAFYSLEIILLAGMPKGLGTRLAPTGPVLRYLRNGFAELGRSQPIVGTLVITVLMNVFAFPYIQLLPVFARDVLHTDAIGLGALGAAAGVGSLFGSLLLAAQPDVRYPGRVFSAGSIIMCIALVGFALSSNLAFALALVAIGGFGSAGFSSFQSTIILRASEDHLRGRAMGALTLAIGLSPFGMFEIGLLTTAIGPQWAVATNCALCAVLVFITAARLPRFREDARVA